MSLWVPISYLQSGDMTQLGPGKFPYKILHTPLARPYRFMPLVKSVGWYLTSPIPPPHLEFVYVIGFIFPMEKMFSVMTFLRFLVTPTIYDPNYIWFVFSSKSMFYIVVQQPSCSFFNNLAYHLRWKYMYICVVVVASGMTVTVNK